MSLAIKVENIAKAYQLGQFDSGSLSGDLKRWWALKRGKEDPFLKIGESNDRTIKGKGNIIWSLKNIDFEIQRGEAIGIIGRNGAGKSTLLKILSQVTTPTSGSLKISGRAASLLEVGTGFHPELTGRENIFLNGAILGMHKHEIVKNFDEIVDFSGVERFIDTPVKRYSSGMYVRLAFAVAAHLQSEILIVDEVLAVGDAEFQKKCLGKMNQVSKNDGRTILFVSHNISAINQLCEKTILLSNGELREFAETNKVINTYLNSNFSNSTTDWSVSVNLSKKACFTNIILSKMGVNKRVFSIGETLEITFEINIQKPNENDVKTCIEIKNSDGLKIANVIDVDSNFQVTSLNPGKKKYKVKFNDLRFYPDTYYISLWCGDMTSIETYDYAEDIISFDIIDGGSLTSRTLPKIAGLLFLTPEWNEKK